MLGRTLTDWSELRPRESARLERGLLPQPLISTGAVQLHKFYRPGRQRALLGGDFYDAVQTGPEQLALLVGAGTAAANSPLSKRATPRV